MLQGDPRSNESIAALNALAEALRQCHSYALVRFVKRTDSDPWLCALLPTEDGSPGLVIQRLPCAEDIRGYSFPSLSDPHFGKALSKSQNECMSELVDVMTVSSSDDPRMSRVAVFNPSYQSFVGEILKHAVPTLNSPVISDPMRTPPSMMSKCNELSSKLIREFPTQLIDKSQKKRKIYWSDFDTSNKQSSESKAETKSEVAVIPTIYSYIYIVFLVYLL